MTDILEKFTANLKNVLARAYSLAVELDSPAIGPEHLALSLLHQKGSVGGEILRQAGISAEIVRRRLAGGAGAATAADPHLSPDARRAVEKAVLAASSHGHRYVGTEHLLAGLLQADSPALDAILAEQGAEPAALRRQAAAVLKDASKFPEMTETCGPERTAEGKDRDAVTGRTTTKKPSKTAKNRTPGLEFFAVELTDPELQKKIDPVIGRDPEIERVIQILCRRTKNNPALLGEPGVGKTAIVEGLAKKILSGDIPDVLADKRIFSLDLGLMLAGTVYRGEFENRVKQVIEEVKRDPDIILFIDELHNIAGAGATAGSLDAANILKPALARGDLRCIGATTPTEYKKSIENDGALERRFQPVNVEPPSLETAKAILRGLRANYEAYHCVEITDEAIEAAVALSDRYLTDRFLPDKAVDLIDEAAARVRAATSVAGGVKQLERLEAEANQIARRKQKAVAAERFIEALELRAQEKKLEKKISQIKLLEQNRVKPAIGRIGRQEVAAVVALATGIPLADLLQKEKDRLLRLEDEFRLRLVGQEEAIQAVADLVRRAKAGMADPKRPLASFLFLGPSGTGKTEMAKILAETVFHDPEALVRLDMSEFAEGFNLSKLIGSPAGYVGYKDRNKLTDAVKRKPHAVVLFDEIEKAHDEVHNLLLQVLEDGQLTDAAGRRTNFRNSIIVMTSNVGASQFAGEDIGFASGQPGEISASDAAARRARVVQELEKSFRPEFLNRIDRIVVFNPLAASDLKEIASRQLAELAGRVSRDHGLRLTFAPGVAAFIAAQSWNPLHGARGVRRQIQELVETPLAKKLLADELQAGDEARFDFKNEKVTLIKRQTHARATVK